VEDIKILLLDFVEVGVRHVRRAGNGVAHSLAKDGTCLHWRHKFSVRIGTSLCGRAIMGSSIAFNDMQKMHHFCYAKKKEFTLILLSDDICFMLAVGGSSSTHNLRSGRVLM
jgi:hypothetical protein